MSNMEFFEGNEELLDTIGPLWQELNQHHKEKSVHFKSRYETFTFEKRKKNLLEKARKGQMKIIVARDVEKRLNVGYCISSIDNESIGEIESLYIKPEYRKLKLGDTFMTRSLEWIESFNPAAITIGVAAGNEEALGFYNRYGFFTKMLILEKKK